MSNFNYWHNEVADMPSEVDGEWVDLETGFTYKDWLKSLDNKPKFKPDQKISEARNVAKKFGGKALTGTSKQKSWAEKIRANVLNNVIKEHAEILCHLTMFESAKFWIETRTLPAKTIGEKAQKAASLIIKINQLLKEAESKLIFEPGSRFATMDSKLIYDGIMEERQLLIKELDNLF